MSLHVVQPSSKIKRRHLAQLTMNIFLIEIETLLIKTLLLNV